MLQELNFTFPPEQKTELFVLGNRMSLVALEKFDVAAKKFRSGQCCYLRKS